MSREDIVLEWANTNELNDYLIQGSRVQAIGQEVFGNIVAFGQVDVKAGDTVSDINARLAEAYKNYISDALVKTEEQIKEKTDLILKSEEDRFDLKRKKATLFCFLTQLGQNVTIAEEE